MSCLVDTEVSKDLEEPVAGDGCGDEPLDSTLGTDQEPILDVTADQFHYIPLGYVQGVPPPENIQDTVV